MRWFDWSKISQEQLNNKLSRKFLFGEKIMVAQLFLKQGCVVPEHSHESEQLSMVITGSLRFKIGNEEISISSNQVVTIPSGVTHSVTAIEDSLVFDIFSPLRTDWLSGDDSYLRQG